MSSKDERRDTLRGVGDDPPSEAPDEPRARQGEFTVPPQVFEKPNTGWFRRLKGEDEKDTVKELPNPLAGIPVRSVEHAKDEAAPPNVAKKKPQVLAIGVVIAAIALGAIVWRVTRSVVAAPVVATTPVVAPSTKRIETPRATEPSTASASAPVIETAPAATESVAPRAPQKSSAKPRTKPAAATTSGPSVTSTNTAMPHSTSNTVPDELPFP
jgi:hypothetical protein